MGMEHLCSAHCLDKFRAALAMFLCTAVKSMLPAQVPEAAQMTVVAGKVRDFKPNTGKI